MDYADLAETLAVLSYPARLELLDILRAPHTAAEIRLSPHRVVAGENPERAVSKQAVQAHLDKLVDVGLVRVDTIVQDGRATNRYVMNSPRFYAILEELRQLNLRYAGRGATGDDTGTLMGGPSPDAPAGPRLVLVHGVYEGKQFPLDGAGGWTIGRAPGAAVRLDYDPFVSMEHAFLAREGDAFLVSDAPESKNGTQVNWQALPKGAKRRLRAGDVVGVGRSLLSFVPE